MPSWHIQRHARSFCVSRLFSGLIRLHSRIELMYSMQHWPLLLEISEHELLSVFSGIDRPNYRPSRVPAVRGWIGIQRIQ